MKLRFIFMLCIGLQSFLAIQAQDSAIELGQKYTIKSEILGEERSYWVNLPASYDGLYNTYKSYPVLFLLDGHVHFASVAGMCQFMGRPSNGSRKIPEMIVVAVMNVNRQRDFTPDKIVTARANDTGGGADFLAFLEKELIPSIDSDFRTEPFRVLFGHSLGGLITSYAYLQPESAFNAFIAVDPSFGTWDSKVIDEKLSEINESVFKRPIYIATANWDKRNIRNRDRHILFYESLNSKCQGVYKGKIEYFEHESHSTVSLPAFYNAMSYLFEGYYFSYRNAADVASLVSNYQALSDRLNYSFKAPEELINRIGYAKLRSSNPQIKNLALEYFKLNVQSYPNSFNVYDSLGEAEFSLGNLEAAKANFEQSLKLNPENQNAKQMIEKLKN
jgi:predicted alpha/beta superfamily hydrolase